MSTATPLRKRFSKHQRPDIGTMTKTVFALCCLTFYFTLGITTSSHAGEREQAKRIHDRLAGVPPTEAILDAMQADIVAGNPTAAAQKAVNNPNFYRVTLKNFITPWTNEEQTVFAPLNDYTATVIGIIRDDYDFRRILYDDILYTGVGPTNLTTSNAHYEGLDSQGADLSNPTVLIETTQSAATGLPTYGTAGILSTRAAAKAFFVDGTNRPMFRFTLLNHLCTDLEQIKEPGYPTDRITQDVSRSPGGDSRIYMNACMGCHNAMDPMNQAFAYYDYEYPLDGNNDPIFEDGWLSYNAVGDIDTDKNGTPTGTRVQAKYHINASNFETGYIVMDDNWANYWRTGPNSALGWDTNANSLPGYGFGASSFGREFANSEAFAQCQVEKVFKAVCLRPPANADDRTQVDAMTTSFKSSTYNLKQVFIESAVFCMGD